MGIFSTSRAKAPSTPPADLEERIRKLESNVRQLEDDFTDLWDRTRRAAGRAAKREARAEQQDPQQELNQAIRNRYAPLNLNGGH